MSTKWLLVTASLLLVPMLVVGQQQQPHKWSGQVQVTVAGDGQALTLVKSYVNRELRALGDVVVTDNADESEYFLSIIVVPVSGGYAVSALTADHLASEIAKITLEQGETKPDTATIDLVNKSMKPMYQITDHWLQTCSSSGLEKTIKEVVARFDVDTLQMHRDMHRSMQELLHPRKD
jgi:hypothetical protein